MGSSLRCRFASLIWAGIVVRLRTYKAKIIMSKDKLDGRSTRHEARRQQLFEQTIDHLLRQGISNISVRSVAEALGISHRTLLHHFGSKDQMIQSVLEEVQKREVNRGRERAEFYKNDPLGMLDSAWEQLSSPSYLGFLRLSLESAGQSHIPGVDGDVAETTRLEIKYFETAIRNHGVPAEKAIGLATAMKGALGGLNLDLMMTGDRDRIDQSYQTLRAMFQRELKRESA